MDKRSILILGGARSGKSRLAQEMAGTISKKILFVATAEPLDKDMSVRIAKHKSERPRSWKTLEVPTNIAAGIEKHIADSEVVLIDCLTLLVTNLFLGDDRGFSDSPEIDMQEAEKRITAEVESLIELTQKHDAVFIIVSNEVGLGLVPENRLGRLYRDLLGRANQIMAMHVDEVYFMVAGIPLKIKG
ncbi:MAG: bifunctional adenosylcobinamide kinase/adenosylcobinamide-phosphate guanylyltransferase [Dehalococcoidia bacterium]|nr:bifunctional adenosylcobinamide kinase/adenosylcobinamide-phosphate guanylyltransferase [Dehalococcoidia bacterium]